MAEIVRNRTIRPSTRLEKSKSYKINTKQVSSSDILIVNIDHESKAFQKTYRFNGEDVEQKNSISFRVQDFGTSIDISWSGAKPIGIRSSSSRLIVSKQPTKTINRKIGIINNSTDIKLSFDLISNKETEILILGSMPGDKSIALNEYYAYPRNRFWKIISTITHQKLPLSYENKKKLLLTNKIGIWDVAYKAKRKGSLDSAIEQEIPNDMDWFIKKHKNLKVIGFNGTKSGVLFDKYFSKNPELKYFSLPSTSPANTGINFENICKKWRQILVK